MRKIRIKGHTKGGHIAPPDIDIYDADTDEIIPCVYGIKFTSIGENKRMVAELTLIERPHGTSLGNTSFEEVEVVEIDIRP